MDQLPGLLLADRLVLTARHQEGVAVKKKAPLKHLTSTQPTREVGAPFWVGNIEPMLQ